MQCILFYSTFFEQWPAYRTSDTIFCTALILWWRCLHSNTVHSPTIPLALSWSWAALFFVHAFKISSSVGANFSMSAKSFFQVKLANVPGFPWRTSLAHKRKISFWSKTPILLTMFLLITGSFRQSLVMANLLPRTMRLHRCLREGVSL